MYNFEEKKIYNFLDLIKGSKFRFNNINFIKDEKKFSLEISRTYYEETQKINLLLLKIFKSKTINSIIIIDDANYVVYDWKNFNFADDEKILHSIISSNYENGVLFLESEYLILKIKINKTSSITLNNISNPSQKYRVMNINKPELDFNVWNEKYLQKQ